MSEPTEADWLEARDSWRERYGREAEDQQLQEVRGWYVDGRRVHNPFASDAVLVERFDRCLADYTAEVVREAEVRALEEAADTWTQGAWSDYTPPRGAIRPQIILGMAQGAGDWLRARAVEIRSGS